MSDILWTYEIAPNGYHVKDARGLVRAICRNSEDAHLICDMLAALKPMVAHFSVGGTGGKPIGTMLADAREVLSKATGKP